MIDRKIRFGTASRLPRSDECERVIRAIALDTSQVKLTRHARQRLVERNITVDDTLYILRSGHAQEVTKEGRRVKCKMVARLRGRRDAGVVTLIVDDDPEMGVLIIKTVEWEDL